MRDKQVRINIVMSGRGTRTVMYRHITSKQGRDCCLVGPNSKKDGMGRKKKVIFSMASA